MGTLFNGTILTIIDVTSLYTNMSNKEGIDAVLEHVRKDNTAKITAKRRGEIMALILHQKHLKINTKM